MARELSIAYGGVTMGGSSTTYLLDGKYSWIEDAASKTRTLTWTVVVVADTEANFATYCDALEDAMNTRFGSLVVTFGSSTHVNSGTEGFNETASASKIAAVATTGRSRVYSCSVSYQLPASDNTDRLDSQVTVSEDESKIRTLVITGRITATNATGSARTNAESKVPTYAAAVVATLGAGTWDAGILLITTDDQDKVAQFRWEQREIVYDETAAAANNANIRRAKITYSRTQPAPGDTMGVHAVRRSQIVATYQAGVDATAETDLYDLWTNTLRPYLLAEIVRIFQPSRSSVAIVSESPGIDAANNRIDARIQVEAEVEAAGVYSYRVTQTKRTMTGRFLVPVWDGAEFTKNRYKGKASATRNTIIVAEGTDDIHTRLDPIAKFGTTGPAATDDTTPELPDDADENWVLEDWSEARTPLRIGTQDDGMDVYQSTWTLLEEYHVPYESRGPTTGAGNEPGTPAQDQPGSRTSPATPT